MQLQSQAHHLTPRGPPFPGLWNGMITEPASYQPAVLLGGSIEEVAGSLKHGAWRTGGRHWHAPGPYVDSQRASQEKIRQQLFPLTRSKAPSSVSSEGPENVSYTVPAN